MFSVILEKLKYLRGIPMELTEKAVLNGELRRGTIAGITAYDPENREKRILLDIRLTDDEHTGLMIPGTELYLEGQGDVFNIQRSQRPDLKRTIEGPKCSSNRKCSDRRRPRPGLS